MFLSSLGYVGFRSTGLDDWRDYGTRLLGFELVDKSRSTLAFRMDDHTQRVIVEDGDGGQGVKFFGWEVADAAALERLTQRLDKFNIRFARGSRALADERHVKDLIVLDDPLGNRTEIFHGPARATDPFKPGRSISGFRTGPLGLGHVVMSVDRLDAVSDFYEGVLGFGLSDWYSRPFQARFLHINARHHSLAFVASGKSGIHHMMVELYSFDDVGQGLDLAMSDKDKDRLAVTLGRHCGDFMTSFYTWTPSGFMVEYGWGGQEIDPKTWKAEERLHGPSIWGHDRVWLSPEQRADALRMRLKNAAEGLRQPVQVIEGNHNVMSGVCPWWDEMRKQQQAG